MVFYIRQGVFEDGAVCGMAVIARNDPERRTRIRENKGGNLCRIGKLMRNLVPPGGLEPPTNGLEGRCSIRLSYGGKAK